MEPATRAPRQKPSTSSSDSRELSPMASSGSRLNDHAAQYPERAAPYPVRVAQLPDRKQDDADEPFDLIIRNGKIVDGTGNPWFLGDVAVRGDRIVEVSRAIQGPAKRTIDASRKVVAPGFIDIHSHSDYLLLEDGDAQSKIRQGVTTEVLGEGNSAGPYQGKLGPKIRNRWEHARRVDDVGRLLRRDPAIRHLDQYRLLRRVEQRLAVCHG